VDSKVKERIIGAAVLVALGVWLIPWILDGSDPSETAANAVADDNLLPADDDSAVHSETVVLDPYPGDSSQQAEEQDTAPARTPTVLNVGSAESDAAEPDLTDTPPESTDESSTTIAAATSEPDPDGWSVQLGAFGDPANAQQEARRVSGFGYEARVSDFRNNGRTMHRVRVSGFATREQAEVAASSLAAHGFITRVVLSSE
jgi:DedD protein